MTNPTSIINTKSNKWRSYKYGRGGRHGTNRNERGAVIRLVDQDVSSSVVDTNPVGFSTPCRHEVADTSVRVKVINEMSTTPMPQFDSMDEAELNLRLGEFGMRPVGRARAIRMLKRIYEAVHPVSEPGAGTPLAQRVSRSLIRTQKRPVAAARAEKTREKRIRKAISKFTDPTNTNQQQRTNFLEDDNNMQPSILSSYVIGQRSYSIGEEVITNTTTSLSEAPFSSTSEQSSELISQPPGISVPTNILSSSITEHAPCSSAEKVIGHLPQKKDVAHLLRTFLDWLRSPENQDLYYELLTLNPVLLERLASDFGEQIRVQKISRAKFSDMLDHIHITYCVSQHDNNHY